MESRIEEMKSKVIIKNEGIDHYNTLSAEEVPIKDFANNLDIKVLSLSEEDITFDIAGIDPSTANALRRIFISEIPTMAIEKVNMWQNTSVIPDEVLAHRMGLVPIKVDPRKFDYKNKEDHDESNCVKFKLHVKCTRKNTPEAKDRNNDISPEDDEKLFNHASVYTSDMKWEPIGKQKKNFKNTPIRPVYEDILLAKLRPGQEIEMELLWEKGIGKTHAKWSPVATTYYRLLPDITLKEDIIGEEAEELKSKCPMNVFDIEDSGKLFVKNSRACTTWRECIRDEKFTNKITLAKLKNHFEFTVESVGMLKPEEIVTEGIKILQEKVNYWKGVMKQMED
jgi:DNA-directed RNA polymerases I and III subunit RPAC1